MEKDRYIEFQTLFIGAHLDGVINMKAALIGQHLYTLIVSGFNTAFKLPKRFFLIFSVHVCDPEKLIWVLLHKLFDLRIFIVVYCDERSSVQLQLLHIGEKRLVIIILDTFK